MLPETVEMSYSQRLEYLQLPSLKHRRLRGDMIQMYKIVKGIDDIDATRFFERNSYDRTRSTGEKIFIKYARTNAKKNCFSRRAAPIWNTKLTELTKTSKDVNTFKNYLDREPFFIDNRFRYDEH